MASLRSQGEKYISQKVFIVLVKSVNILYKYAMNKSMSF